jgi:hypothetical protein
MTRGKSGDGSAAVLGVGVVKDGEAFAGFVDVGADQGYPSSF